LGHNVRAVLLRVAVLTAFALLAGAATASAAAPGRWALSATDPIKAEYYQGIASDPAGHWYFDGFTVGGYRTDLGLNEQARGSDLIPAGVLAGEGYNHIGDWTWDAAEGGRLLAPMECYTPGQGDHGNTCGTGALAVVDPISLTWRYYVKLDPAEIAKAMWAQISPDGSLVWTSSGPDLLAYRAADVTEANAGPAGPVIHAVRRLRGAVPPSGVTGATFVGDRVFLAGQQGATFQVWSVDPATGARRLEIERTINGESEGLDTLAARGGVLHWQVQPISATGPATFGAGHGELLSFVPRGQDRLRATVSPAVLPRGRATRVTVTVTQTFAGHPRPVAGAIVRLAGRRATTDARGRARLAVHAPRSARAGLRLRVTKLELRGATARLRVRG
jgi:hypothetical protein